MFKQLFEISPDAMILVDSDGRIVDANAQADRLFGYAQGGLIGTAVEALMPEGARARHHEHRARFAAQPRLRPMGAGGQALTGRRKDGSEFPVEIALSPVKTEHGPRFLASIRDISDSLRAQQALLRADYDRFVARVGQLALASTDEEAVMARLAVELVEAMHVSAALIISAQPAVGRFRVRAVSGLDEALDPASAWSLSADNPLGRVLADGQPLSFDDLARSSHSTEFNEWVTAGLHSALLVPMFDRDQPMGALILLDTRVRGFDHDAIHCLQSIAHLLSALIQRRRTEDQLAHSQRLDAIGQLTGGIAHDFNNLLTVVSGNLQLLELECPEHESAHDLLAGAQRAVDNAAALTSKLLTFARRQHLSPRRIELPQLLKELGSLLRRTLGDHIQLAIEAEQPIAPVFADPPQLESALLNLALNSRDAMPRGGQLHIHASDLDVDSTAASALELDPGAYVRFSIIDSGLGMSAEVLEHAFEPFFTTKQPGKGNGLGLSMVYGFARQSGGQLRAESRLGYGTRIDLYLPVDPSALQRREEGRRGSASQPAPDRGNECVLVVEDDPAVREIAVAFLRSLGYRVRSVAQGEEALQLLQQDDAIDMLFSDVVLGSGISGLELAQAARTQRPRLAVLLTSGYEHQTLPQSDIDLAEFKLLRKPYRREQLAQAIRAELDRRS